jgi:hypothetical protein
MINGCYKVYNQLKLKYRDESDIWKHHVLGDIEDISIQKMIAFKKKSENMCEVGAGYYIST